MTAKKLENKEPAQPDSHSPADSVDLSKLESILQSLTAKVDEQSDLIKKQQDEIESLRNRNDVQRSAVEQTQDMIRRMRDTAMNTLRSQYKIRNQGDYVWRLKILAHKKPRFLFMDHKDLDGAMGYVKRTQGHEYDTKKLELEPLGKTKDFKPGHQYYDEYLSTLPSYGVPVNQAA